MDHRGLVGAAVAPTDPAVMLSVLGGRELEGRSGTTLEGEAGVNDPAGVALMIGMIELATHDGASFAIVIEEFDERRDIEAVRRAVRLARRDGGSLAAFVLEWQPAIARCAEQFLRVLAFAEAELTAEEIAALDHYAQQRLGAIGEVAPI